MLPFKKILSPTDFSEPSIRALRVAVELAQSFSAEIILIHVVSPIPVATGPVVAQGLDTEEYLERMLAYARESLDRVVSDLVPENLNTRTLVFTGNPGDEIGRAAKDEGADLIVIASHGLTGWRRFIFGSVAERVVRFSPCPVLTVPAEEREEEK